VREFIEKRRLSQKAPHGPQTSSPGSNPGDASTLNLNAVHVCVGAAHRFDLRLSYLVPRPGDTTSSFYTAY